MLTKYNYFVSKNRQGDIHVTLTVRTLKQDSTLKVKSFAGRNFRGDKLSRTPEATIKFGGYKLSRTWQILVEFSYFDAIFSDFSCNISRTPMKVRFRGYKLSRTP